MKYVNTNPIDYHTANKYHYEGDSYYNKDGKDGKKRDLEKAVECWTKGASFGGHQCMMNLAWAYTNGVGCEASIIKASYWKSIAEDHLLREEIATLIYHTKTMSAVLTGTDKGYTARWLGRMVEAHTIEMDEKLYSEVEDMNNVTRHLGDSPTVLKEIIETLPKPTLFFLDTRWEDKWPLLDEIRVIGESSHACNTLIVIQYYKDKMAALDWGHVEESIKNYFPSAKIFTNEKESGQITLFIQSSYAIMEERIFSQKGQDGVIEDVMKCIGSVNEPPYYVEFGFNSKMLVGGTGSNVANLNRMGWTGLLLDEEYENKEINLHKEKITSSNVCDLFRKYGVPKEPDYVSIDIDSCDLWVFKAILQEFRPRLISVEYNLSFPIDMAITFPDDQTEHWEGDRVFGASLKALSMVAEEFDYVLAHVVVGLDAFFVRKDIARNLGRPLCYFKAYCVEQASPSSENTKQAKSYACAHGEGHELHGRCTSGRESIMMDYETYVETNDVEQSKIAARKSYPFIADRHIESSHLRLELP